MCRRLTLRIIAIASCLVVHSDTLPLAATFRAHAQSSLTQITAAQSDDITMPSVDFVRQVLPAVTQAGCNSGACHGAAAGRGYLQLSLFGSRPEEDYRSLLFQHPARFVDLERPELSKLLQKPVGYLDHGGGVRLDEETTAYKLIQRWVQQGAERGSGDELLGLDVSPGTRIVACVGERISIQFHSQWKSGARLNVTSWMTLPDEESFTSPTSPVQCVVNDDAVSLIATRPGYWPVTLRFLNRSVTLQLLVRQIADAQPTAESALDSRLDGRREQPLQQRIDAQVASVQSDLGVAPADRCRSSLLVRRWWFDLAGRLPAADEWDRDVGLLEAGKGADVIDSLLGRREFALQAAEQIAAWASEASRGRRASAAWQMAVADHLGDGESLPSIARRMLLTSVGGTAKEPLTDFHLLAAEPRDRVELITGCWLGVRMGCARCHDHPLDHWTQDDYYGLAACLAEIDVATGTVRKLAGRTTTDLRTGRDAVAKVPVLRMDEDRNQGVSPPEPGSATSNLVASTPAVDEQFIDWLLSAENKLFHRNVANRVWAWLVGSGLYLPVDDQRATNPALHAELLDELAEDFRRSGGNLKQLVRGIVLSETYARKSDATAIQLELAALKVRKPKPILTSPHELARPLVGEPTDSASAIEPVSEGDMLMAEASSDDDSCARGIAVCADPIRASLELVAGDELNEFIHATIVRTWQDHEKTPHVRMLELHWRLFHEVPGERELAGWPMALQRPIAKGSASDNITGDGIAVKNVGEAADSGDPSMQRVEIEAAEDLLWSWLVSDRFRRLH